MYSPYRLVQFVRISNIYSCCFIVNCTRNHVITNTNRPFSGADPGICGTGETNFDSENTWFLFLGLEIKNGLSTLRERKRPVISSPFENFSVFPSLSFDEPDQVNTLRLNCSFLLQITFVVNLFQLLILLTSRMRNKKIKKLLVHHPKKTWKRQHLVFFQFWVQEEGVSSSRKYFSEFELFSKVNFLLPSDERPFNLLLFSRKIERPCTDFTVNTQYLCLLL